MSTETLLIPDIAWIEIPGGPFLYGERSEQRTIELPTFWIAKYPVTNCQYQTFIDAGGYEDERWWNDLVKPEPEASQWPQPNRPKTNVNWYEAVAFCRWLSAMLELDDDTIRLPTEQEWEKAARGENGLNYPWGPEYQSGFANIDETETKIGHWYLQQTVAVGLYPYGRSSYGVEDLSGNVWEWCLNKYEKPNVTAPDTSGDMRVLRGGSWINNADNARADNRNRNNPDNRNNNRGFRVLSSLHISPSRPSAGPADHGLQDAAGTDKWRGCIRSARFCVGRISNRGAARISPAAPHFEPANVGCASHTVSKLQKTNDIF